MHYRTRLHPISPYSMVKLFGMKSPRFKVWLNVTPGCCAIALPSVWRKVFRISSRETFRVPGPHEYLELDAPLRPDRVGSAARGCTVLRSLGKEAPEKRTKNTIKNERKKSERGSRAAARASKPAELSTGLQVQIFSRAPRAILSRETLHRPRYRPMDKVITK